MLVMIARSPDGSLYVQAYADHTAEILDANRTVIHGRMSMDELSKTLARYGLSGIDLIEC